MRAADNHTSCVCFTHKVGMQLRRFAAVVLLATNVGYRMGRSACPPVVCRVVCGRAYADPTRPVAEAPMVQKREIRLSERTKQLAWICGCGATNSSSSTCCSVCGLSKQSSSMWVCPLCPASNPLSATKCHGCGVEVGSQTLKESQLSEPKESVAQETWQCHHCNALNQSGERACRSCSTERVLPRWKCRICGTQNKMSHGKCLGCGAKNDMHDWICGACNTSNFSRRSVCFGCGAVRGTVADTNTEPSDTTKQAEATWECQMCSKKNEAGRRTCQSCLEPRRISIRTSAANSSVDWISSREVAKRANLTKILLGDWECPKCSGHNFSGRKDCFVCGEKKPRSGVPATWKCRCSTVNFASATLCTACQRPRADAPTTSKPSHAAWQCPTCSAFNRADRENCHKCRSMKGTSAPWNCICGAANESAATVCVSCGDKRPVVWRCPLCNSINLDELSVCGKCEAARPSLTWTCEKCGTANESELCSKCMEPRSELQTASQMWVCPTKGCGVWNFARRTTCLRCHHPRPSGALLSKAVWRCPQCGQENIPFATSLCPSCRQAYRCLPGDWTCPKCSTVNFNRRVFCGHCREPKPSTEATKPVGDNNQPEKAAEFNSVDSEDDRLLNEFGLLDSASLPTKTAEPPDSSSGELRERSTGAEPSCPSAEPIDAKQDLSWTCCLCNAHNPDPQNRTCQSCGIVRSCD